MTVAAVWKEEQNEVPHIIVRIFSYIQEHYAYICGILYVAICFMGIVYDNVIYYITGVNPLLYFDLSDFLLSGLRHPMILVIPILLLAPITFAHIALRDNTHRALYMSLTYGFALLVALATPIFTAYIKIPDCGQNISIDFGKDNPGAPFRDSGNWKWLLYSSTSKVLFATVVCAAMGLLVTAAIIAATHRQCARWVFIWSSGLVRTQQKPHNREEMRSIDLRVSAVEARSESLRYYYHSCLVSLQFEQFLKLTLCALLYKQLNYYLTNYMFNIKR